MRRLAVVSLMALFAAPAAAKVAFTGYADLHLVAYGSVDVAGPAALLAPYGVRRSEYRSLAFNTDAVGLFATTNVADDIDFLMDVTYVRPSTTAPEIKVQYAYLDYRGFPGTSVRGGRFTLPFGYYNQKHFYPFRRHSITPPYVFAFFLGLPMADSGVGLTHRADLPFLSATLDAYAVNGYGSFPGSTTTFRSAVLPGGLSVANNLGRANNNKDLTLGGRLALRPEAARGVEFGGSYMRGEWDQRAEALLELSGVHGVFERGAFEAQAEAFRFTVRDDAGFAAVVGSDDWKTDAMLARGSYRLKAFGKWLTPWARVEDAVTRGNGDGGPQERLRSYAGGVTVLVNDHLSIKTEVVRLHYRLPVAPTPVALDLVSYNAGLSLTY